VKASERVGIQTTDGAVYLCYGGEGVLPKVDGAIYAPCAREDDDGLDRGKVGVTRAVKIQMDTYGEGIGRTVVHLDVFVQQVVVEA